MLLVAASRVAELLPGDIGPTGRPLPAFPEPKPLTEPPAGTTLKQGMQSITLQVNGNAMTMEVEPRTTLLSALRDRLDPRTRLELGL